MEQMQQQLERAQGYILSKLPEDRQSRIFLFGGVGSVAGVVMLPVLYHSFLGRQLSHTRPNASSRFAAFVKSMLPCQRQTRTLTVCRLELGELASLPKDVVENAHSYRVAHDKTVKHIPDVVVVMGEELEGCFTKVLRRNMTSFSYMPQGWLLLWLASSAPDQRRTFSREYIHNLDFKEGDVVCGVYRVVKRTGLHVEIELQAPKALGPVSGLMIISIRPRNEGAALVTETIQWTKKDSGAILPLERWIGGFLHSLASRWLAVTGGTYLQSLSASR